MRRIGQWMLNALTALSLLLCVGTALLWVDSYRRYEFAGRRVMRSDGGRKATSVDVTIHRGTIRLLIYQGWWDEAPDLVHTYWACGRDDGSNLGTAATSEFTDVSGWSFTHRAWIVGNTPYPTPSRDLNHHSRTDFFFAPVMALWLCFALLPAMRLYERVRRRRWAQQGRCPSCSYDLTGNVSGVCPECGMKIAEGK